MGLQLTVRFLCQSLSDAVTLIKTQTWYLAPLGKVSHPASSYTGAQGRHLVLSAWLFWGRGRTASRMRTANQLVKVSPCFGWFRFNPKPTPFHLTSNCQVPARKVRVWVETWIVCTGFAERLVCHLDLRVIGSLAAGLPSSSGTGSGLPVMM